VLEDVTLRGGLLHGGVSELVGTTVRGNRAICGGGIVNVEHDLDFGGYHRYVDVSLVRSTVSGNHAECGAAGIYNGGFMSIAASTVTANVSEPFGDSRDELPIRAAVVNGDGTEFFDFGWRSAAEPRLDVITSIVAGHDGGRDCCGTGIRSLGYNLESGSSCGFGAPGDVVGVDPHLGALANNGGPTLTHALHTDSPARDAIPHGVAGCGTTLPTDQRGLSRPDPGRERCDIGAYELQPGR
jgi:hypothetical protein